MLKAFATLLFTFYILLSASAQTVENPPYFKGFQKGYGIYHWSTSNGLPQSHISAIAQTRNHLLWLATYDGMICYDGKKFTRANVSSNQPVSSFITSLHAIGDSVIWASTKEVIVYYNNAIRSRIVIPDPSVFIASIKSAGNTIYLIAHNRVYQLKNDKLEIVLPPNHSSLQNGSTILASVILNNKLLLLTSNKKSAGIYEIHSAGKTTVRNLAKNLETTNIESLNGHLFQQTGKDWHYSKPDFTPGSIYCSGTAETLPNAQSGLYNNLSYFYSRRTLEITTRGETVMINTASLTHGNELFATLVDHTGNLWLGTNSYGLFMVRHYPFEYPRALQKTLVTNSSHAFADNNKLIWFDNDCRETIGMDILGKTVQYRIPNVCNWVNENWSEDSLVLFAYGPGHSWFNKRTNSLTPVRGIDFPVNNCYKLSERNFIISGDGAMYHWDGVRTTLLKRFRNKSTLCNQILKAGDEHYYFATTEGLYELKKDSWKLLVDGTKAKNADFRSVIHIEDSPYLLLGTAGKGIARFHVVGRSIEWLPHVPAPLQNCWSMIADNYHQLWVTSNNGIVQLSIDDIMRSFDEQCDYLLINHYRYETGIENVEFNSRTQNKGYLLDDGRIIFSSLAGPIIVHPQDNSGFNARLANLMIDKIEVNEQETDAMTKKLIITEGDFVRIHFTLPTYSLERVLQFEYRIKGYRNDWKPAGSRQITVDNLPAGNYQLEIRITSGKRKLFLPIEVKKDNPSAWIAYVMLTLLCIFVVIIITAAITRFLQRRKHAANNLRQRLKILEMEALQSQMNPHFIFNCLNTIQFLFISGNTDKANQYLSDFSSLMRLMLDLLRGSVTTLDNELKANLLYIRLEQLQFDDGFEFRMHNNLRTQTSAIRTPSMFLQIFVENAIIHGLKKTKEARPILTLTLDETDDKYIFRVGDNGPGFSATTSETHKSLGLSLIRERFNLQNEVFDWDIDFNINEMDVPENDVKTEIVITFGKSQN